MKHICYIFIDEMSFIGPKLFVQIESCLHESFQENKNLPFGRWFIIIFDYLGQLLSDMDTPLYAEATPGRYLWNSFTIVVTLQTIFCQQGQDAK